jgi:hypothetical protein
MHSHATVRPDARGGGDGDAVTFAPQGCPAAGVGAAYFATLRNITVEKP